jgi:chorismate synthase
MLRLLTAGESHGKGIIAVLDGFPSGVEIDKDKMNFDLRRRQGGYGRGGRMKIERDKVDILSGVRFGVTMGSPITLRIENRDWENWKDVMAVDKLEYNDIKDRRVTRPRPGHADLSGGIKYNQRDLRNVLERSSARETAARVAAGSLAKMLLKEFDIDVYSFVIEIGGVGIEVDGLSDEEIKIRTIESDLASPDRKIEKDIKALIDRAKANGDSVGGMFKVVVKNPPVGLGSHVQWYRKLDGRIAMAIMSIPGIKGVEIGGGFDMAKKLGSEVHDEIFYDRERKKFYRKTNNAGGIEGGISNGEDIIVKAAMKPIPTLYKPLRSVDIDTKEELNASIERADICSVPAASVVGEAVVSFEIARAFLEKFGGDSLEEIKTNYNKYKEYVSNF